MNRHHGRVLLVLLLLTASTASYAITRETLAQYAASLKGLKKEALKTAICNVTKPTSILDYGSGSNGTWWGFWYTDRIATTNECINRYSSSRFYFTSHNGSAVSGMNIEHSFPKSWWGGSENEAYRDLYNLYPSDSKANSAKGNYPMGVVTTVTSSAGEGYDKVGTGLVTGIGTINLWEPGDTYKGDFSRSYMYMVTRYQNFTWGGTQGLQELEQDTWPTFRPWAYQLYLKWSKSDIVADGEVARNEAVATLQGNRNLFVDYPYLDEYVWGDSTDVAFDPSAAITTASNDNRYPATASAVATPVFSPAAGAYTAPQTVTLSCATASSAIYYTLDGSTPTAAGTLYTTPITVDKSMTIKALAIVGADKSAVAAATYRIGSTTDVFRFAKLAKAVTPGKRYLIVADNSGLLAARPVSLASGKTYGYLYTKGVTAANDIIELTSDTLAYTFAAATGGVSLMDGKGMYYYQQDTYSTFTPTADVSQADTWTVTLQTDGTYIIKAADSGNFIQYSPKYTSFGNYATAQSGNLYPYLYEEVPTTGIAPIRIVPSGSADDAVYTLQGVRVNPQTLRSGIYIRNGRKFVVK